MICQIVGTTMFFRLSDVPNYKYGNVIISNLDVPVLTRLLNQDFAESFGRHGLNQFQRLDKSMDSFFYWEFLEDGINDLDTASEKFNEYAKEVKEIFHAFSSYLWFAKDNSVNIPVLYGLAKMGNKLGQLANDHKSLSSNCVGEFKQVEFSAEELDMCIKLRSKFLEICPDHRQEDHWGYNREVNRIEKAFKFLCEARCETYLPAKIAALMSCFECLFSTDPGELTQKISERLSYYIGECREEKIFIFETVKDAYEIRSRYLHGSVPKKRLKTKDAQIELSTKIDTIARRALTKVIMTDSDTFLQDNEELEKVFKNLIFH